MRRLIAMHAGSPTDACRRNHLIRLSSLFLIARRTASSTSTRVGRTTAGPGISTETHPLAPEDARILSYPYEVVNTPEKFTSSLTELARARTVALDVEAFCTPGKERQLGTISLVQACSDARPVVYLFDVLTLTNSIFAEGIRPLLMDTHVPKLFFDCRRDVEALSCQMGLTPRRVRDLQLQFAALQWRRKSSTRRSGLPYVLKAIAGVDRAEGDAAVQTAMMLGRRPVWDVRPLPPHFLEYAAGDVRHIYLLSAHLNKQCEEQALDVAAVERLSTSYVDSFATGKPVVEEPDSRPAEVSVALLERFIGPGGSCAFCGAKGHSESECFKRDKAAARCGYCGSPGHTTRTCFKKNPQLLKCDLCGQIGHSAASCFKRHPCEHCGGLHSSSNCHKAIRSVSYFA